MQRATEQSEALIESQQEVESMTPADNLARKAIVIPASQTPEEIKLRVAAYCRVSSDSEDQRNSFAAQNAYYTEFITGKENWELVDIYADEGITGTSAKKRPDFQRLLTDCRKGKIDKVLVKSISRFARNTRDCLETTRELKSLGISVVFEEQNIDTSVVSGEMLTAVFAACAQAESESISKNVRWGVQKRMQNGTYLPPHQPFGYYIDEQEIHIHLLQAKYVCEIFKRYLAGENVVEIAAYMKDEQGSHPELANWTWNHRTIACILRNEKYLGDSLWQKTYRTNTLPRADVHNKGEIQQYYASHTHPAIISEDSFHRAQDLLAMRMPVRSNAARKTTPYSRRIICGFCGTNLRSKQTGGVPYLICRKHADDQEACPLPPVPEYEIEVAFLRMYYKLKHSGLNILTELQDNLLTIRSRQMLWHPDVIELNKQISNLTSQGHMLTVLNQQGAVGPDIFISQSNQLAQQLRKAKRQKEKLLEQDGNDTLSKTRELLEILEYGPEYLDAFDGELFRELVDRIIVESNERIRFRLINGLELPEEIERTVR